MRMLCGSTETANGVPCTRFARHETGRCAWHDGINVQRRRQGKPMPPSKACTRCKRELPRRRFRPTGRQCPATGERYGASVCRDCEERERRAAGVPKRHPRYNARGEVWCNRCQRYQHADNYRPHPNRPGTFWSYCKACTIQLDRERYHRKKLTPAGWKAQDRRAERARVQAKREFRERTDFVVRGIDLLGKRGFTLSEIGKLIDISLGNIYGWTRHGVRPTPAVAERVAIALRETAHLKAQATKPYRRRIPHSELSELLDRIAPQLERHPVRNRWRKHQNAQA